MSAVHVLLCLLAVACAAGPAVAAGPDRALTAHPRRDRVRLDTGTPRLSPTAPDGPVCYPGSSCDACPRNHYGPACTPCADRLCSARPGPTRGRCDDGSGGTGQCRTAADAHVPAFALCHDFGRPCDIKFAKPRGNLILSTLFTQVLDPQRNLHQACIVRNTTWYHSVRAYGLSALVFHDCLPDEEVVALQTQQIRFFRVDPPRKYSTNDYRFMLYYGVLSGQPLKPDMVDDLRVNLVWSPPVAKAYATDLLDVTFAGNPFELIFGDRYQLYVGSPGTGSPIVPEEGGWNTWMFNKGVSCGLAPTHDDLRGRLVALHHLNGGIVGGPILPLLSLLRHMTLHFMSSPAAVQLSNCNMVIVNKCVHDLFSIDTVFTGWPLHSGVKSYEPVDCGAYIIHK